MLRGLTVLMLIGLATPLSAQVTPAAVDEIPTALKMRPGLMRLYRSPLPMSDVLVGTSEVADVITVTDRTVAILAKKEGFTTIMIMDSEKKLISAVSLNVSADEEHDRKAVRVSKFLPKKDDPTHNVVLYNCGSEQEGCLASSKNVPPPVAAAPVTINMNPTATSNSGPPPAPPTR